MNPVIGQVLDAQYSWSYVIVSFVISCAGSLLALQCAGSMFRRDGTLNLKMASCAAVALGGIGIWSMHFIGMLAYRLDVAVSYDLVLTAVSLLAAVLISGVALYLAGRRGRFGLWGWIAGSLLAGVGVCVMHYLGMYAMNMRATMEFDFVRVVGSFAIAIVAASAALWLAFNLQRQVHRVAAALVMGLAICAMHYVGMSAATMICTAAAPFARYTMGGENLGLMVMATSSLVLISVFWIASGEFLARWEPARRVPSSRIG